MNWWRSIISFEKFETRCSHYQLWTFCITHFRLESHSILNFWSIVNGSDIFISNDYLKKKCQNCNKYLKCIFTKVLACVGLLVEFDSTDEEKKMFLYTFSAFWIWAIYTNVWVEKYDHVLNHHTIKMITIIYFWISRFKYLNSHDDNMKWYLFKNYIIFRTIHCSKSILIIVEILKKT